MTNCFRPRFTQKLHLILFLVFTQTSLAGEFKKIEASVSGLHYRFEISGADFIYEESSGKHSLPLTNCDLREVSSFWSDLQKDLAPVLHGQSLNEKPAKQSWIKWQGKYYPYIDFGFNGSRFENFVRRANSLVTKSFRSCNWTAPSFRNQFSAIRKDLSRKIAQASNRDFTDLTKSCVEQICPHPEFSIDDILARSHELAGGPLPEFDKDIQPFIQDLAAETVKSRSISSAELVSLMDHPPVTENEFDRALFLMGMVSEAFKDFTLRYSETQPPYGIVDRGASRKKFSTLSDDEFNRLVNLVDALSRAVKWTNILEDSPAGVTASFNEKEIKAFVQQTLQGMEKTWGEVLKRVSLRTYFEIPAKERFFPEAKRRILEDFEKGGSHYIFLLNDAYKRVELLDTYSKDDSWLRKLFLAEPESTLSLVTKDPWRTHFRKASEDNEQFNKTRVVPALDCRLAFARAKYLLPTEIEKQKFFTDLEKLRKSMMTWLQESLNAESAALLIKRIDQFSGTSIETFAEFKTTLQTNIRNRKV